MRRHPRIEDTRLGDLLTLLAVSRRASITGAAHDQGVTPSQVSKAIDRVERQLGVKLLVRGTRGTTMSEAFERLLPEIQFVTQRWSRLRSAEEAWQPDFTLAAPSYLHLRFLPLIAKCLPRSRIRGLEMGPNVIRAYASENVFDAALTLGAEVLPKSWVSTSAGEIRKSLFGSPAIVARLGHQPIDVTRLADVPFVSPVYNANGRLLPADDGCPLPRSERRLGHEVETVVLALEVAAQSGHVVFGPDIAASSLVERGALAQIRVRGWNVSEELFLACNSDRMLRSTQQAMLQTLRKSLPR